MSADFKIKPMLSGKVAFWISLLIMAVVTGPSMNAIPPRGAPPFGLQLAVLCVALNTPLALMSIRKKNLGAFTTRFFLLSLSSFIGLIVGVIYALVTYKGSFKVGG
ncbi:MAG: hypothetical protein EOP52_04455 [Sphingobacteriales bacterium]|nr:MAG: hypothetical protein EOP52_04455 [Sphingobacteriales bacterium]